MYWSAGLIVAGMLAAGPQLPVATTPDDFLQAGTQPGGLVADIVSASGDCIFCHAQYDPVVEPYRPWAAYNTTAGSAATTPRG